MLLNTFEHALREFNSIINNCNLLTIFQIVMFNLKETIKVVDIQKLAN